MRAVGFQNKNGMIVVKEIQKYLNNKYNTATMWTELEAESIYLLSIECGIEVNNKTTDTCRRANAFSDCVYLDMDKVVEKLDEQRVLEGRDNEKVEEKDELDLALDLEIQGKEENQKEMGLKY